MISNKSLIVHRLKIKLNRKIKDFIKERFMGRIKIKSIVESCKGNIRRLNQDRFLLNTAESIDEYIGGMKCKLSTKETFQIYGVFDGMGGTSYGEEAASIGTRVAAYYRQHFVGENSDDVNKYLAQYFRETNEAICQMVREKGVKSSGTTAALVCLFKGIFYCANIGDTRIYLLRDKRLKQLSVDHTEQALFEKMNLMIGEGNTHLNRHRLTQHLGIESEEMIIEPYYFQIQPKPKDIVLLCSDGLNEKMSDEMIEEILLSSKDIEEAQRRLLEEALKLKGKDNITVMLLQVCKSFF